MPPTIVVLDVEVVTTVTEAQTLQGSSIVVAIEADDEEVATAEAGAEVLVGVLMAARTVVLVGVVLGKRVVGARVLAPLTLTLAMPTVSSASVKVRGSSGGGGGSMGLV